jgi:Ca2+-binding RTX toxin-like protein
MALVRGTNNSETIWWGGVTWGNDTIYGEGGNDLIHGLGGSDAIYGGLGADTIYGDGGNDSLWGGDDADHLDGGAGIDTAFYLDSLTGVVVDLLWGTGDGGTAEGDTLVNIENLIGSDYDDLLFGNDAGNALYGQGGADFLSGGLDNDNLYGGIGDDSLKGGGGADHLSGGSGVDTASYYDSPAGVQVYLDSLFTYGGDAEGDTLSSIENITGSAYRDSLRGDQYANTLTGMDGDDFLSGAGNSDRLYGGNGADHLAGGVGDDILEGGAGQDTLIGEIGADIMRGGSGDDTYIVDSSADVVIEAIGQGAYDAVLTLATFVLAAGSEVEFLGGSPSDTAALDLIGNEFDNTIIGNGGSNTIAGGAGLDTLIGWRGLDTMTGGSGGDRFVWQSTDETRLAGQEADIVMDFNRAEGDLLDFSLIDANATGGAANDTFTFAGVIDVTQGGSFTAPGQIGYFTADTDGNGAPDQTYILLNTEVDAGIDYQDATIHLVGGHTVDASWFVV